MLSFFLNQIWFGIDDSLLNFFTTLCSIVYHVINLKTCWGIHWSNPFACKGAACLHAKALGQRRSPMAFAPQGILLLARRMWQPPRCYTWLIIV